MAEMLRRFWQILTKDPLRKVNIFSFDFEVGRQQREVIAHLLSISRKDLRDTRGTIGYHATSLEAIGFVIEHGYLPGRLLPSHRSKQLLQKGDIYFFPVAEKFPDHHLKHLFPEDPIGEVYYYAEMIAAHHCLAYALGVDLTDPDHFKRTRDLTTDQVLTEIEKAFRYYQDHFGLTKEKLNKLIDQALQRKGIIIGLSDEIVKHFVLRDGDLGEGDLRINCPQGLPYRFFSRLRPVGPVEKEFFSQL